MADSVSERVLSQYPSLAFLLNDAEVGPLLRDAVNPDVGFDSGTFYAKLQETAWWRNRSEWSRQLEIERHTDPTTFQAKYNSYDAEVAGLAASLGVSLDPSQRLWMATLGMEAGVPADSQWMRQHLVSLVSPEAIARGAGTVGVTAKQVQQLANGRYFAYMPEDMAAGVARAVANGWDTMESVEERMRQDAMARFPHLRQQLGEGQSVADIVNPYRAVIAEELELNGPEAVDVMGKWGDLLGIADPKSGQMRLPTQSEVVKMARSQDQWWSTSKGRQYDSEATRGVLQMMGARA